MEKYANDYKDFSIVLSENAKASTKGEIDAICPQCDYLRKKHGEKKLRVNQSKGTWFCQHCGWTGGLTSMEWAKDKIKIKPSPLSQLEGKQLEYWINRGISRMTLSACMVQSAIHPVRDKHTGEVRKVLCTVFPYTQNGWQTMVKYRDGSKNFAIQAGSKLIPWGLDWIKHSKECIIVEGEPDRLSYHEAGLHFVVSVPNGATISIEEKEAYEKTGKLIPENTLSLSYFDNCYEDFASKTCIYIATDADPAGVKLRFEIARRFGGDRCKYIDFSKYTYLNENSETVKCKDANDILRYLGKEVLKNTLKNAEGFPIDDVVTIDDIWEEIQYQTEHGLEYGKSTGISSLNPHFTWKMGHPITLNGYNNMGKTHFGMNLILLSAILYGWKWGIYSPENYPVSELAVTAMEIYIGNTIDPKIANHATFKDIQDAKDFIRNHIEFVNNEDGYTPEQLRKIKKQMIVRRGIHGFFTDPWNSLSMELKGDTMDNYLTKELSAEVRFSINNQLIQIFGTHPQTPMSIERKEPRPPSEYEITGGAIWSKKMYEMLSIHYDKKLLSSGTAPMTQIYVLKTKNHRIIGVPTREHPVMLQFKGRCHRYLLENGTDPFEIAKKRIVSTTSWEIF
jgi:twinkle protein